MSFGKKWAKGQILYAIDYKSSSIPQIRKIKLASPTYYNGGYMDWVCVDVKSREKLYLNSYYFYQTIEEVISKIEASLNDLRKKFLEQSQQYNKLLLEVLSFKG